MLVRRHLPAWLPTWLPPTGAEATARRDRDRPPTLHHLWPVGADPRGQADPSRRRVSAEEWKRRGSSSLTRLNEEGASSTDVHAVYPASTASPWASSATPRCPSSQVQAWVQCHALPIAATDLSLARGLVPDRGECSCSWSSEPTRWFGRTRCLPWLRARNRRPPLRPYIGGTEANEKSVKMASLLYKADIVYSHPIGI
jgi:hypothetical protein